MKNDTVDIANLDADVDLEVMGDSEVWVDTMLSGLSAEDADPYGLDEDPFADDDQGFYSSYDDAEERDAQEDWFVDSDPDLRASMGIRIPRRDAAPNVAETVTAAPASVAAEIPVPAVATASPASRTRDAAACRVWARQNGYQVGNRGVIAQHIWDDYLSS